MATLIIVESCYGNTSAVAEAIGETLDSMAAMSTRLVQVQDAPETIPDGTDLLVLAAPTHDYSLPTHKTRLKAHRRGAIRFHPIGLREWIAAVPPIPDLQIVTVDTAFKTGFVPSTAGKAAAKLLKRKGFEQVHRGATFFVTDHSGPLDEGELIRAQAWANTLASLVKATAGT
ncbi:MAG: hypothetical protein LBH68_00245 [Bifidobacteriaceae bacterium]|jgi:hypothetical protein|nr:hypothetical protein [Bifidobacteriaceae bacterium]